MTERKTKEGWIERGRENGGGDRESKEEMEEEIDKEKRGKIKMDREKRLENEVKSKFPFVPQFPQCP